MPPQIAQSFEESITQMLNYSYIKHYCIVQVFLLFVYFDHTLLCLGLNSGTLRIVLVESSEFKTIYIYLVLYGAILSVSLLLCHTKHLSINWYFFHILFNTHTLFTSFISCKCETILLCLGSNQLQ